MGAGAARVAPPYLRLTALGLGLAASGTLLAFGCSRTEEPPAPAPIVSDNGDDGEDEDGQDGIEEPGSVPRPPATTPRPSRRRSAT